MHPCINCLNKAICSTLELKNTILPKWTVPTVSYADITKAMTNNLSPGYQKHVYVPPCAITRCSLVGRDLYNWSVTPIIEQMIGTMSEIKIPPIYPDYMHYDSVQRISIACQRIVINSKTAILEELRRNSSGAMSRSLLNSVVGFTTIYKSNPARIKRGNILSTMLALIPYLCPSCASYNLFNDGILRYKLIGPHTEYFTECYYCGKKILINDLHMFKQWDLLSDLDKLGDILKCQVM